MHTLSLHVKYISAVYNTFLSKAAISAGQKFTNSKSLVNFHPSYTLNTMLSGMFAGRYYRALYPKKSQLTYHKYQKNQYQ